MTENIIMKWLITLIISFALNLSLVNSQLHQITEQSIEKKDHTTKVKNSHCQHHKENDDSPNSKKNNDCMMACCHLNIHASPLKLISITPKLIKHRVLDQLIVNKPKTYTQEIFHPPIC